MELLPLRTVLSMLKSIDVGASCLMQNAHHDPQGHDRFDPHTTALRSIADRDNSLGRVFTRDTVSLCAMRGGIHPQASRAAWGPGDTSR